MTKSNNALRTFCYRAKGQSLYSLIKLTVVGGRRPHPSEICAQGDPSPSKRQISAYNVSTLRDSEKMFNYNEQEVDRGLSNELLTSYNVHVNWIRFAMQNSSQTLKLNTCRSSLVRPAVLSASSVQQQLSVPSNL